MRTIETGLIVNDLVNKIAEINFKIDPSILKKFQNSNVSEKEKTIIDILIKNSQIADSKKIALCQDTGIVIVFAKVGIDIRLEKDLQSIVDEAVKKAYQDYYLRKSVVSDPLDRKNTGDNSPAIVYTEIVNGDDFELRVMVKGGGSENASALWMLDPAEGAEGIINRVVERIAEKGANCCPPLILGIGIGGDMEQSAILAKKALFRKIGERHFLDKYSILENKILTAVNALGVGAGGFGGKLTAMDVFIETAPCHIASLPVALNVGCHSNRHCVLRF